MPDINKHRIQINGTQVPFQGFGKVRSDLSTEQAAELTKHNGLDEYIIEYENGKGQNERAIVWGDQLDFKFTKTHNQPDVTVDGKPARILAYDDEVNSVGKGMLHGAGQGFVKAFDAVEDMGKRAVAGVAIGAGATVVGGTVFALATKGGVAGIGATLAAIGQPVAWGAALVAGAGVLVIGGAGALKGGIQAKDNKPKMETIAAVVEDSGPKPPAAAPSDPKEDDHHDVEKPDGHFGRLRGRH